ncbi:MAG: host attachment protein [Croceibacterium sp.]
MNVPHEAHVAVVDGDRFLLLRNTGTNLEPKLELIAKPALEATNFSAGVRDQDPASQRKGTNDLNELAHAAAAAEWLNRKVLDGKVQNLVVVADPKTLGEMRRHYHKELEAALVGELAKAVTGAPLPQIEKIIADA